MPSHVSARDSKYHHGSNQFAAAVDSLKGSNSLIGEMFQKLKGQNHVKYMSKDSQMLLNVFIMQYYKGESQHKKESSKRIIKS